MNLSWNRRRKSEASPDTQPQGDNPSPAEFRLPITPPGGKPKRQLSVFLRAGIFVLTAIVAGAGAYRFLPMAAVAVSQTAKKELPIYCVNTTEKKVALSFDAAWGNEDTQAILDILAKYDVRVTFFMTGGWIEKYPEDVKAIAAAGHDLGNHSENHKQMSKLSAEECVEEIMKPHEKVKELTGQDMILFRPPYGDYNNTLISAVRQSGYHCIQWDVDTVVL